MLRTRQLTWAIAVLVGANCTAQTAPAKSDASGVSGAESCLHRIVPITVLREPQQADQQALRWQIHTEGVNANVLSVRQETISPRIVLLLDTSGSMGSTQGKWTDTLLAATFVLDTLPPKSPVAFATFDQKISVSGFGSTNEIRGMLPALKDARPGTKRTALYSAIDESLQLFGAPRFGDTVFVVTDGGDNSSQETWKQVAKKLIGRGIRAFAFIVRSATDEARARPKSGTGQPT